MLLISPKILRDFGFHINYAYFFRVVPFQWDYEAGKLCLRDDEKTWTLRSWKFVVILIFLHQTFIILRFYQSVSGQMENLIQHVFEMVFILGFAFISAIQVTFVLTRDAIVKFVNNYIQYFKGLQGKSEIFNLLKFIFIIHGKSRMSGLLVIIAADWDWKI